jgi:hypothetical protein
VTLSRCVRLSCLLAALLSACGSSIDLGGTAPANDADGGADAASCPNLAPPATTAPCDGCSKGSKSCQANGCFNGYLCNVSERDCKVPGTKCEASSRVDAQ